MNSNFKKIIYYVLIPLCASLSFSRSNSAPQKSYTSKRIITVQPQRINRIKSDAKKIHRSKLYQLPKRLRLLHFPRKHQVPRLKANGKTTRKQQTKAHKNRKVKDAAKKEKSLGFLNKHAS